MTYLLLATLSSLMGYGIGYARAEANQRREREAKASAHDAWWRREVAQQLAERRARELGASVHPLWHACQNYPSLDALIAATKEGR